MPLVHFPLNNKWKYFKDGRLVIDLSLKRLYFINKSFSITIDDQVLSYHVTFRRGDYPLLYNPFKAMHCIYNLIYIICSMKQELLECTKYVNIYSLVVDDNENKI